MRRREDNTTEMNKLNGKEKWKTFPQVRIKSHFITKHLKML